MRYFVCTVVFFWLFQLANSQDYVLKYSFKDMLGNSSNANLIVRGDEAVFKVNDSYELDNAVKKPDVSTMVVVLQRKNTDKLSSFSYSTKNEVFTRIPFIKGKQKEFIYRFDAEELNWTFVHEIKKIGVYTCQKATLQLHGRYYEAWFTTEVPIGFGPFRLNALPGMIVEVTVSSNSEEEITRHWKLLSVKKSNKASEVFDFHKQFFLSHEVMDYCSYEDVASMSLMDYKRRKLAINAAIKAKWAKERGYESDAEIMYLPSFFTNYFIDIPNGITEKLDKIN